MIILNYWFKILESEHMILAYNSMPADIENKPYCVNWASKLRDILSNLGFYGNC